MLGSSRIIWLALAATGPAALLVPLAEPGRLGTAAIVGGLAIGEFGQIIYAISSLSLRQRLRPDQYLGRVTGTMRFLIMGAFPLGSLLGGALGETAGVRAPLWLAAVLILLSPVPLYLAPRGSRDVDELVAPPPVAEPPTG